MIERQVERHQSHPLKTLFLVDGPQLLAEQLNNQPLSLDDNLFLSRLASNVSTDALFPTKHAFATTGFGQFALTGFPGIEEKTLQAGQFHVLVAGPNFGCGSGREQAVLALKEAGIKYIFARSFSPIFEENCLNNGLYPLKNFALLRRFQQGESVPHEEILVEFNEIQREILKRGGLLPYSLVCLKGEIKPPEIKTRPRPMTMAEKIIAQHLQQAEQRRREVFVKPGDEPLLPLSCSDICFTYELHTPLIKKILERFPGEFAPSITFLKPLIFEDHIVWWGHHQTAELLQVQADFAAQHNLSYYSRSEQVEDYLSAQGICHLLMVENHVLPGQIVIGPDSHTCTAGALGSLAFCVEPTGLANAMLTGQVLLQVPESVKVILSGELPPDCTAKDVMLFLLAQCRQKPDLALGKILEYTGSGLKNLPLDELLVLTNMATETGAFTGILEPTDKVIEFLVKKRDLTREQVEQQIARSDAQASYSQTIEIDLSRLSPFVAQPGHPQNSVPLAEIEKTPIQKAFIGSCTGGKLHDLRLAAQVLESRKVNYKVQLVIQAASMKTYQKAIEEGLAKIFAEAGAWFLPPCCGACIGLGPGRIKAGEVGISASNRNFPGRMGEGDVYLANPLVVAASAVNGFISRSF